MRTNKPKKPKEDMGASDTAAGDSPHPDYKAALARAARYCAEAEHSEAEVRAKLRQWGCAEEDADRVIDYLTVERYIDDSRYAAAYTQSKLRYDGWGPLKIANGLKQKGVAQSVASEAINDVPDEEWRAALRRALAAKLKSNRANHTDRYHLKAALARLGTSRGFACAMVMKTADEVLGTQGDGADDSFCEDAYGD